MDKKKTNAQDGNLKSTERTKEWYDGRKMNEMLKRNLERMKQEPVKKGFNSYMKRFLDFLFVLITSPFLLGYILVPFSLLFFGFQYMLSFMHDSYIVLALITAVYCLVTYFFIKGWERIRFLQYSVYGPLIFGSIGFFFHILSIIIAILGIIQLGKIFGM